MMKNILLPPSEVCEVVGVAEHTVNPCGIS